MSKRGASSTTENPQPTKIRGIIAEVEDEEEEGNPYEAEDHKKMEGDGSLMDDVRYVFPFPSWTMDDDDEDDDDEDYDSLTGKTKTLEERRMDWIVRRLNKPEVFRILQNPEPWPPRLIPTWHTFQHFKRGQKLIQNSGYKSAQISDSLRKLVLRASPYYFKLEANWSKAWSDPVQDGCVSINNHGEKTVNSSTRTGAKAALRPSAKADGGEVEETTEGEISRNASKNNKDKDAMDAWLRVMKHSEVIVQKGKTSISALEEQGSLTKTQNEENNSIEPIFGGDGSDRMQSLTEAVPITLKDDKKLGGEAELLIMKHPLALKEIEAKDKEDARRAVTFLEERWMELEMQRVNKEHLIGMAQLQKEKDIEIHNLNLAFWFGVGVDCFSFSQVKDIKQE
ncbi:hypothetical protein EC991_002992 [Linnemannia zychae]|nr:hypothetical protein EC991_002992 [Linnemannia zychae]